MPYALPAVAGLEQYQQYNPTLEEQYDGPQAAPPPPPVPPPPVATPTNPTAAPTPARYNAEVERWRPLVSKYFKPQDIDKALYVISGESGGDPTILNREGSGATGLFQIMPSHGIKATDPETSIQWAAAQVANHGWTDWGEGVTYQGKPFGILGLAPYGGSRVLDSWESPQTALAGRSSVSGAPTGGRAMPAISNGVDYGPASEEAIQRSKLNSASRAIIGNPEMQAADQRFDVTTAPENRSVNGIGAGDALMSYFNPLEPLKNIAEKGGEAVTRNMQNQNAVSNPFAVTNATSIGVSGGVGKPVIGSIAASTIPQSPFDLTVAALPAVAKAGEGLGAVTRALIGLEGAPEAEELASLPKEALRAASRRYPESPAQAVNVANITRGIAGAAEQAKPIASEGDAVLALRSALREGLGSERAALVSAGRKSQASRIEGALETSDQSGLELAREAGKSGAGKILPEGGIGFKLPPEADDHLVERGLKLHKEGKLSVFDAVYGIPKALDEGRRLGPTPAQAKLLSKLTDIDEHDFVQYVRQRNVFEKASKEAIATALAKVGEGEDAAVRTQLQAAKRAQILADKAAALGKSEQAAKLRAKALVHIDKADELQRTSANRYVAQAEQKAQRAADKANELLGKANNNASRMQERADNADTLARLKADTVQAGPAQSGAAIPDRKAEAEVRKLVETSESKGLKHAMKIRDDARLAADVAERESTERYIAKAEETFQRNASKAAKAEADQARKVMDKLTEQAPNPEMILKRAIPPVYGPGLTASNEAMDTAKAIIAEHLRGNRAILDSTKDAEGLGQLVNSVKAVLTGETSDSFLNALLYRSHAVRSALIENGMEPKTATMVVKALGDAEMSARFPNGVPEKLAKELESLKQAGYNESWGGLQLGVQRFKNTMFGLTDVGVFGTHVLTAVRRGGVEGMAGLANRTLATLHLPSIETNLLEAGINKKTRNILDGVHYGTSSAGLEPDVGTVLSYLGAPGRKLDEMLRPLIEKSTKAQFDTVMGTVGDLMHEGNLVMLHLAGRDISDPAVRAAAAESTNAIKSFSRTALKSRRNVAEQILFTSSAMTRAGVANILQMSKVFRPGASAEERILGAGLIASQALYTLIVGKYLNDVAGVTDFEFDPSKPGFGQITLPWKDGNGRNRVIDLFPQASIDKAITRSIRELSSGDENAAADAWLRYFSGRGSSVGRGLLGLAGVGYSASNSGQFTRNLGVKDRLLNLAPIPPLISSVMAQAGNGGIDLTDSFLNFTGFSAFPESTYGLKNREAQDRFGKDYKDLLPSEQKTINELPNIQGVATQDKKSEYKTAKDEAYGDIQARQDQAESAFKSGNLTQPLPDLWKNLSNERKGARLALQSAFKEDLSKFDKDAFDKAVDGYYGIESKNADGTVDFDKTEYNRQQYLASLPDKEKTWLNDFLGVQEQNSSDLRRQYFDYLDKREAAGYFRDGITTSEKSELDRQNPDIDVQTWFFNSGIKDQKNTPALQTAEAVNEALQMGLPNREVKLAGLGRAINENEGTLAAWKRGGDRIAKFVSGSQVDKYREQAAMKKYKKSWNRLTDGQQAYITSLIQTGVRKSSPDLDAMLAWFGKYSTLQSRKAVITLREFRSKYGREPESADGPIRFAAGV